MDAGIDVGNDGEQRRIGFQTYVPQRMSGFAGVSKRRRGLEFEEFPELLAYLMRRFPNPTKSQQGAPEAQADIKYRRSQADHRRDRGLQQDRRRARRVLRAVHDRGLARHHLDHDAERALRDARCLSRCDRARDEQGVPGDPQGRAHPPDRRARSRDGPHHDVPRSCPTASSSSAASATSPRSTRASKAFRATGCGCTSATATGRARTSTTSRWRQFCRRSTPPMSAR